jgi:hypothetical protein
MPDTCPTLSANLVAVLDFCRLILRAAGAYYLAPGTLPSGPRGPLQVIRDRARRMPQVLGLPLTDSWATVSVRLPDEHQLPGHIDRPGAID